MLNSYKELVVWQKAIDVTREVYEITSLFPQSELYGLTNQMRRSAVSIPSNIAEGYKRRSLGEYVRFLTIADGSAAELETQIIIAEKLYSRVNYLKTKGLLEEVQKMLGVLIKKLKLKKSLLPSAYP